MVSEPESLAASAATLASAHGADPGILLGEAPALAIYFLAKPIADPASSLPAVGLTTGAGADRLIGIGPNRYLLVRETDEPDALSSTLAATFAVVTEMTDAFTRIRISGSAILDLLAKGSALDLDALCFPPGTCASAPFAQMPAILHHTGGGSFDLYVGSSYARSMFEWLDEAATEFGCRKV